MRTDDTVEMVFRLCDGVPECLGRLELGPLGATCWLPVGVPRPHLCWRGPLMGGWGMEPREMAVRAFILGPRLSREKVPTA